VLAESIRQMQSWKQSTITKSTFGGGHYKERFDDTFNWQNGRRSLLIDACGEDITVSEIASRFVNLQWGMAGATNKTSFRDSRVLLIHGMDSEKQAESKILVQ